MDDNPHYRTTVCWFTSCEGVTVYEQSPDEFAQDIMRIVESGANVIGGCCGTTPLFIEKARQRLFDRR